MLILTRKQGQSIYIGDGVIVRVVEVKGHQVRLGIEAGKDIKIYREEIWQQIQEQNKEAAATTASDFELEGLTAAWQGRGDGAPRPRTALSGIKIDDLKKATPVVTPSSDVGAKSGEEAEPEVVVRKKRKKKHD